MNKLTYDRAQQSRHHFLNNPHCSCNNINEWRTKSQSTDNSPGRESLQTCQGVITDNGGDSNDLSDLTAAQETDSYQSVHATSNIGTGEGTAGNYDDD